MTVRDLIQSLLLESPDLDATVYVQRYPDPDGDPDEYVIKKIDSWGSNDAIFIEIKNW